MLNNIMTLLQNSGNLLKNPMVQMFMQNFQGKDKQQQMQTMLNMAEARGKNIHEPIISKEDFEALCKIAKANKNIKF